MKAENLLKNRLAEPGQFIITLEYTVPDVADPCMADLESLAKLVAEDSRVAAMALTDRVPSITTHDTIDLAIRARDLSGKSPLVHLSGKNRNIDNLRERIQRFVDNDLENVLILTGDKPRSELPDSTVLCPEGFLDAVQAVDYTRKLCPDFFIAAAVSSFKYSQASQTMQYMKMKKKIDHGANAIFNQVGLDMRKIQEMAMYAKANNINIPLVHALYWPTAMLAKLAIQDELPGVVATQEMQKFLESLGADPDKGKGRRTKILALQTALCRVFGLAGVHFGGVKNVAIIKGVLDLADELSQNNTKDQLWQQWQELWKMPDGKPVNVAPANGFYFFQNDGNGLNSEIPAALTPPAGPSLHYKLMNMIHDTFFEDKIAEGKLFWKFYNWAHKRSWTAGPLNWFEWLCKYPLVQCQHCGSCSLPECGYICVESACAKHLPNGPCGGSKVNDDECEVIKGKQCAWVKVYDQAYNAGVLGQVASNYVPPKNIALKNTCSWVNMALKLDHRGRPIEPIIPEKKAPAGPAPEKK
ncbi:MAG: methylenetetrahydrofolate reductase C-terminal domain-containing protein [Phycisphaerae bacterium]